MDRKALRKWRKEVGMTQSDLAQQLGITQSIVSRWERGSEPISAAMAERLMGMILGSDRQSQLLKEAALLDHTSIGRALFDPDGLKYLAGSRGFRNVFPLTHGGHTVEILSGMNILDHLINEVANILHDDEVRYQLGHRQIVTMSCVTDRATRFEQEHGIRHRMQSVPRMMDGRIIIDVTYNACDTSTPLGCDGLITVDDILSGKMG